MAQHNDARYSLEQTSFRTDFNGGSKPVCNQANCSIAHMWIENAKQPSCAFRGAVSGQVLDLTSPPNRSYSTLLYTMKGTIFHDWEYIDIVETVEMSKRARRGSRDSPCQGIYLQTLAPFYSSNLSSLAFPAYSTPWCSPFSAFPFPFLSGTVLPGMPSAARVSNVRISSTSFINFL